MVQSVPEYFTPYFTLINPINHYPTNFILSANSAIAATSQHLYDCTTNSAFIVHFYFSTSQSISPFACLPCPTQGAHLFSQPASSPPLAKSPSLLQGFKFKPATARKPSLVPFLFNHLITPREPFYEFGSHLDRMRSNLPLYW